ncbi:MAG: PstS family phosphate ABC transporter substrate-binding protein [Bacteroidota bacterium]|jgi:phosphate transport system substrate-binding protein
MNNQTIKLQVINFSLLLVIVIAMLFISSCDTAPQKKYTDNATSGNISITVDESYQPIVDSQLYVFHSIYEKAHVKARYTSEDSAYLDLLFDTVRCIIVGREPNNYEKSIFDSIKIKPRITKIAVDGVALIVNPQNPDSLLDMAELQKIFLGNADTWNKVRGSKFSEKINIVFDRIGSANARYIKEKFSPTKPLPSNCFALKSNQEVIKYVEENKGAMGLISINWISDRDDPKVERFLKNVRLVALADSVGSGEHFKPYQAYLALKNYPLLRNMLAVSKEARTGLGTGFVSFIAGEKGQRMVLKSGMVPINTPVRIISTE